MRLKYLKEFRESHIFKINFEESSNYWKFYSESMSLDFNKKNEIISGGGTVLQTHLQHNTAEVPSDTSEY